MENMHDLVDLMLSGQQFDTLHRALRLRISYPDGISDRVLLPQRGCQAMTHLQPRHRLSDSAVEFETLAHPQG